MVTAEVQSDALPMIRILALGLQPVLSELVGVRQPVLLLAL